MISRFEFCTEVQKLLSDKRFRLNELSLTIEYFKQSREPEKTILQCVGLIMTNRERKASK